jgi:hypothetical protein
MEAGKAVSKQAVEMTEGNRQNFANTRHKVSLSPSTACPNPHPLAFVAVLENYGRRRVNIPWPIGASGCSSADRRAGAELIRPGFGSSQPTPGLSETPGLCHRLSSL